MNKNLSEAPKATPILLFLKGFPAPLVGCRKDDFEGEFVLILPAQAVRPAQADEEALDEFNDDPDGWFQSGCAADLESTNLNINIVPDQFCLAIPPGSWTLLGWQHIATC